MNHTIKNLSIFLFNRLDVLLSIFLIVLGLCIIIASEHYHLNREYLGYASIIASLLYLYYKRKPDVGNFELNISDTNQKYFLTISMILFVSLFISSLILLQSEIYHRPALYFVFVTLSAAIILAQILFLNPKKKYLIPIILIEIIILSISLRASVYFNFAGIYGFDPNFHYSLAENIAMNGHTPSGVQYASFPAIHFISSISYLISGLSLKNAFFILSIIEVLSSIFIFFLGKYVFDEKIGLISVLILNFANYDILWGYWLTPMTIATALMAMILYVVFKMKNEKKNAYLSIILILLLFSSVINHSLSTFAIFVILISFLVADIAYSIIENKNPKYSLISVSLLIFFSVLFISYWIYAYYQPNDFFTLMVNSLKNALIRSNLGDVGLVSTASEFSYLSLVLMELGFTIFVFLLIIGLLKSLSKEYINRDKFLLFVPIGVMFIIIYVVSLAGINVLLPERWFVYLYLISSFFVVVGIFELVKRFKSINIRNIIVISTLSVMIFFMITTPVGADMDSPVYSQENTQRNGPTVSEMSALNFIMSHYDGNFSINSAYGVFLDPLDPKLAKKYNLDPRDPLTYRNSAIILRGIDITKGIYIPFPKKKINEVVIPSKEFLDKLENKSITYSNGEVKIYF